MLRKIQLTLNFKSQSCRPKNWFLIHQMRLPALHSSTVGRKCRELKPRRCDLEIKNLSAGKEAPHG